MVFQFLLLNPIAFGIHYNFFIIKIQQESSYNRKIQQKKEQFKLGNRSVDLANVLNVFFFSRVSKRQRNDQTIKNLNDKITNLTPQIESSLN